MRRATIRIFAIGLTGLLCVCMARETLAAGFSFTPLGHLPGGDPGGGGNNFYSAAFGVSADGSVIVGTSESPLTPWWNSEAFRWTHDGGMVGLGFLAGQSANDSSASDVSADGSVVVGESYSEAFRWTAAGGMVGLGNLAGQHNYFSPANAVSADGSVIAGWSGSVSFPGSYEAFRWTAGGGMAALGDLAGGPSQSEARGISADGSVVVGWSVSASGVEAFRWTSGGMVGLGDLPGGGFQSRASGVSADGSVVVGQSVSKSGSVVRNEAFRWTTTGGMLALGSLPGGDGGYTEPTGVSADGASIVGIARPTSTADQAFLWTLTGGMVNLRELLTANGVSGLAGWSSMTPRDISADGGTVVGYGINPSGQTEAWMATVPITPVPEPSTLVLAGMGLFAMALCARCRLRNPAAG